MGQTAMVQTLPIARQGLALRRARPTTQTLFRLLKAETTSSSSFGSTGRSLKSTTADRGLPMTEISPPSPDPMAFALNDGVSPLTQLQKSYGGQRMSMKSGVSKYSSKSGRSGKSGGGLFGLGWGAPAMPQPTYSRTRDRLAPGDGLAYPPRVLDQKR